ncbi:hypothetical protein FQN60_005065, partial [Etheostoma spectabile]
MVDRLSLSNVCEGEPLDMSCRIDRGLDSPDSGLPPSPSPSAWLLPVCADKAGGVSPVSEDEGRGSLGVALLPTGQGLEHCRQTIMAMPHSTWRHYKTQLEFQPRHRPQHFKSTTIVYPKKTSSLYTTELSYNCHRLSKRFLSSVELEAAGRGELPQIGSNGDEENRNLPSAEELSSCGIKLV